MNKHNIYIYTSRNGRKCNEYPPKGVGKVGLGKKKKKEAKLGVKRKGRGGT